MRPKLVVVGSAGKMGRRIMAMAVEMGTFEIIGAVDIKNHPDIGKDAALLAGAAPCGLCLSSSYPVAADVVIDFSHPQAADETIQYCLRNGSALVLGTTGLSDAQMDLIDSAAGKIPVIYATNMSVGMNVLFSLVGKMASLLGNEYDIEIVEQHHRFKKDAPSGSALTLAKNICSATGRQFPACLIYGRSGKDALRQKGTIAIHAVRAGDITGRHNVIFSTLGETVTIEHTAHSRDGFAAGALRAALWLTGRKPALYSMADCLGLE